MDFEANLLMWDFQALGLFQVEQLLEKRIQPKTRQV
jgi:hypothetical protein